MNWDTATDIVVYTAVATVGILGVLGLYQWVTRKSFQKIDPELLALIAPLALLLITYFLFDHIFIWNTRPDGSGEPSFPSTHTMITATVFLCTALLLPRYIKNKPLRLALDCIMLIFIILVPIGRVIASKHWVSDCIGALIFSALFTAAYYFTLKKLQSLQSPPSRSPGSHRRVSETSQRITNSNQKESK